MSFTRKKYLQQWRENIRELWIMCYGKVSNREAQKKKELPPKAKSGDFHIVRFPRVKLYADYLREWENKRVWRPIAEVRARMARDKAERGVRNL